MGSSRERWSSSPNGGAGASGDGWSATLGSTGSAGACAMKKKKKKFVAPECDCGAFAILSMSSTLENPNRLFFGCPYYKTPAPHCRFFAWLDEYVALFNKEVNKPVLYGHLKPIQTQHEHGKQLETQQTRST
ncbi:hypothetical protein PIB30_019073 [Stylosanthes scabra]|uniref:GRF-type domain-containing protein n=1 Tax=Stylosanthes scabra TaxID=79078 RepID=A0ABU6T916_9FABA|nr:hypothetical protein [Stylosanthes scabra]